MANKNSKAKLNADRKLKRKGVIAEWHGKLAFQMPDIARKRQSPRSWRQTKRHPANVAIGTRKIGDQINLGNGKSYL